MFERKNGNKVKIQGCTKTWNTICKGFIYKYKMDSLMFCNRISGY